MPVYTEKRILPYAQEQLFALVADVDKYPEFLPWCLGARVRKRSADTIEADLIIGFKMVRERFTSRVKLSRPDRIDVEYAEGPFKYLQNRWLFHALPDGRTEIDFYVDFEFRSRMLQKLIELLFTEAVRRMVAAFEGRARVLYGKDMLPAGAPRPAA